MRRRCFDVGTKLLLFLFVCLVSALIGRAQVRVVNLIPQAMSNETNRDSEPNVAVNPANPMQIAASAFTPDPLGSTSGPIFVSTDGGMTWALNVVLPGGNRTVDVTLRFARTSNVLYAGILRMDNTNMNILRTANFLAPGLMAILVNRANEDQPYVQAETVPAGPGAGNDRVYVGHNDFNVTNNRTATNQIAVTPKPGDVSAIVTYPAPTVMDNCPGATVVCSPPSGGTFPLGMATVNCTATDTGGSTASCSFKVTVFDVCLEDDASGDFLVFNSFTGDYQFTRCGVGGFTLTGKGMITRTGCLTTLTEPKVTATLDRCIIAPLNRGSATIKPNPIGGWFYINDSNIADNTCKCP